MRDSGRATLETALPGERRLENGGSTMDMEEPLDFKSLCEKYNIASHSSKLPTNYSRARHDQISAVNISHVRCNPALQGVISVLEGQAKPPIAKKPTVPIKPVRISSLAKPPLAPSVKKPPDFLRAKKPAESESMKLNKIFRQTLHIMDHSKPEGNDKGESRPQVYRLSCPNIPEQRSPQPVAQDCYEVVDPDFLTKADPSPVTNNDLIKSGSTSPSMSSKTWRTVECNYSFPSHRLSPTKAGVSYKQDGGDDKQKQCCVNKTPKLKSLPSIESLGPPPPKDPRPPYVNLSAFLNGSQEDRTENNREETPGSTYELSSPRSAVSDGECYEQTFHFDDPAESGSNVYEVDELDQETSEEKDEPFVTSPSSGEVDQECYEDVLQLSGLESDLNVYEEEENDLDFKLADFKMAPMFDTLSDPDHPEDSYYEVSDADKELGPSPTVIGTFPSFASSASEGYHSAGETETDKSPLVRRETYTIQANPGNIENGMPGLENVIYTATIMEGFKPEKHTLSVMRGDKVKIIRITDCPKGKWLAQDENGSYGFVPVSCVDISKDILNFRKAPLSLIPISPDAKTRTHNGGAGGDLPMGSDSYFIKSNDVYDDVALSNAASSNVGKSKGFGHLFRKDKGKREDLGLGYITPPLNTMSPEGAELYTQVISRPHEKEKEEKPASWKTIFHHSNKEQRGRSENLRAEGKLNAPGVLKKYAKEEKTFREKFKYTGEINVINVATVNDLAPRSTKDKLELAVVAGETVEVIDVDNEEKIICRNIAGKYGYVRIEYLNFTPELFS